MNREELDKAIKDYLSRLRRYLATSQDLSACVAEELDILERLILSPDAAKKDTPDDTQA